MLTESKRGNNMARIGAKLRRIDFEKMIARGENKNGKDGFLSQTVNGTAEWAGTGWNRDYDWGRQPQAPEDGAWQEPRSNRTGE